MMSGRLFAVNLLACLNFAAIADVLDRFESR
jgi:hypothetical protein